MIGGGFFFVATLKKRRVSPSLYYLFITHTQPGFLIPFEPFLMIPTNHVGLLSFQRNIYKLDIKYFFFYNATYKPVLILFSLVVVVTYRQHTVS
ncbi:hypothetical protein F4824DRAFT_445908 [Ustulina deusta]|nr:hypothetical protein F4824DRAFT_445908 [Ustulina deusta]